MEREAVSAIRSTLAGASPDALPQLFHTHALDERSGVVSAVEAARRRLDRYTAELARLDRLAQDQIRLHDAGYLLVAGVDEVGRGALAGPVSAGAVLLPADARIIGIDDSKRLSPGRREQLDVTIRSLAVAVGVGHVAPQIIDQIGIEAAVTRAVRAALDCLGLDVDHVLADGRIGGLGRATTCIVRGDSSVACIAAASIVAKVERDALMRELDAVHPGYRLAGNKGYGCPEHLAAIEALGPCAIHRLSFAPCSQRSMF